MTGTSTSAARKAAFDDQRRPTLQVVVLRENLYGDIITDGAAEIRAVSVRRVLPISWLCRCSRQFTALHACSTEGRFRAWVRLSRYIAAVMLAGTSVKSNWQATIA